MVVTVGFEPTTFCMSYRRSNQMSYVTERLSPDESNIDTVLDGLHKVNSFVACQLA